MSVVSVRPARLRFDLKDFMGLKDMMDLLFRL